MIEEDNQREVVDTLRSGHTCIKCDYSLDGIDPAGACPECGTPIIGACIVCEYDLSGTGPSGVCPECGVPVRYSIGCSAIGGVSTQQLESIHTGMRLVANLILLYVLIAIVAVIILFSIAINLGSTDRLNATALAFALIGQGIVLGVIFGWFKLTKSLEGLPSILDVPGTRRFVRILLWVFAVLSTVGLVSWLSFLEQTSNDGSVTALWIINGILFVFVGISTILLLVSNVLYLGWFARLIRNKKMYKRSKHFVWTGPILIFLGATLIPFVLLVVLVLYWNMIEYVRRDLKKIIKARAATC